MSQSEQSAVTQRPPAATPGYAERTASAASTAAVTSESAKPAPTRSAAEIERDIESTRQRLAASIDDLADRVHPKAVANRAADRAKLTVIDEQGAPRTGRIAAIGGAVAALAGIVIWRRRG